MKLLLDANLSWRLIKILEPHFDEVAHANFVGLPKQSSDAVIWNFARRKGFDIVTADKDFVELEATRGFPPKVIQLKFGNLNKLPGSDGFSK